MANTFIIIPTSSKVELNRVTLGLTKAFQDQKIKAKFFQPIDQKSKRKPAELVKGQPIHIRHAEHLLSQGWINELLEEVIALHEEVEKHADVVIAQGLSYSADRPYAAYLNTEIAYALDAQIILLGAADYKDREILEDQLTISAHRFGTPINKRIIGSIINRVEQPGDFVPTIVKCIACLPYKKRPKIRKNAAISFIAKHIPADWVKTVAKMNYPKRVSPPIFRNQLIKKARAAKKTIVLPESQDPRILQAAVICTRRKLAHCVLIGDPLEVRELAEKHAFELSDKIKIIDPSTVIDRYVEPMVKRRKHKGLTKEEAYESLQDHMVLATMMLQQNEVDGIVSGAMHTTANTIRPALQLIKTAPETDLVSSIFFMCLPEQVLVYGDCAVNTNPNAKELAAIAIASADSAKLFGVEPKVAMISYSTGSSGFGADVDKVREATEIVQKSRPDIVIDGPLQYDAAEVEGVAAQKAPNSVVAGQATVCIFPDLDTGNAIYKAVQRSANILSIGPMLQGLARPVNALSRGCLVEDIVFTIALTAIQATTK